jgi:hypothetical protein
MEKRGISHVVEDSNYCVFHLGSGPKFVKHAFERCQANAFGFNALKGGRTKKYDGKVRGSARADSAHLLIVSCADWAA